MEYMLFLIVLRIKPFCQNLVLTLLTEAVLAGFHWCKTVVFSVKECVKTERQCRKNVGLNG